jgi:hypothetical protein
VSEPVEKAPAHGQVIIVPSADDIVGFEYEAEAKRFMMDLQQRMEQFALSLHPDKTRLIEFGRFAAQDRARRGLGKPETFNFFGFTHISGRSRKGVIDHDNKGAGLKNPYSHEDIVPLALSELCSANNRAEHVFACS